MLDKCIIICTNNIYVGTIVYANRKEMLREYFVRGKYKVSNGYSLLENFNSI